MNPLLSVLCPSARHVDKMSYHWYAKILDKREWKNIQENHSPLITLLAQAFTAKSCHIMPKKRCPRYRHSALSRGEAPVQELCVM